MALYPDPSYRKIEALLARARVGLISDPHTGPLHARVEALYDAGLAIGLGQDDISDAYYPFGRNNMLEVAFLVAHILWMTRAEQLEKLFDMVTTRVADALGLNQYRLEIGSPATLVVLEQPDVLEALREHAAPQAYLYRESLVV